MKKPEVKNLVALSLNMGTRKEYLENYRNKISSIVAKNFLSPLSRESTISFSDPLSKTWIICNGPSDASSILLDKIILKTLSM